MIFAKGNSNQKLRKDIIKAIEKGDIKYLQQHVQDLEILNNQKDLAPVISQLGNRYMNLKVLGVGIVGCLLGTFLFMGSITGEDKKIYRLEKKLSLAEERADTYFKKYMELLKERKTELEEKYRRGD